MPIYEFYCPHCIREFELRRTISELDQPAQCPECNGKAQRLLSSCGFQLNNIVQVSPAFYRKKNSKKS